MSTSNVMIILWIAFILGLGGIAYNKAQNVAKSINNIQGVINEDSEISRP